MKSLIVPFLLSYFVFVFGLEPKFCSKLEEISVKCGAGPKACERFKSGDLVSALSVKCVGKCMLEESGIVNDGKINYSAWSKFHEYVYEKSRLKEMDEITKKCSGPDGPGLHVKDQCKAVISILKCIFKKRMEANIKPRI